jgi:glycosyltransferase involved in cell wall biosynthesis
MFESIVHVTPVVFGFRGIFGGAERYVESVARAIEAAFPGRYRQTVLGFTSQNPSVSVDGDIRTMVVQTDSFPQNPMDQYGRALWQLIAEHDVVHVHQSMTRCGEVALLASAQLGKICVATDLGGRFVPGDLADHPVALSDRILAISDFSARLLGPRPPRPVDVVMGPVGQAFLDAPLPTVKRNGALFVGRILPHKGVDRLIRAAPTTLPVTIAGSTSDKEYVEVLRQLARGKNVTFIESPEDNDLPSLYSAAAIHIAPSVQVDYRGRYFPNSELMGVTTMEALASGTPVAVANTCSLPSLIGDAPVGECFDDEEQLGLILQRASSGSWSEQYHSQTCREFARAQYSPAFVGGRIIQVYNAAVAERSIT